MGSHFSKEARRLGTGIDIKGGMAKRLYDFFRPSESGRTLYVQRHLISRQTSAVDARLLLTQKIR